MSCPGPKRVSLSVEGAVLSAKGGRLSGDGVVLSARGVSFSGDGVVHSVKGVSFPALRDRNIVGARRHKSDFVRLFVGVGRTKVSGHRTNLRALREEPCSDRLIRAAGARYAGAVVTFLS